MISLVEESKREIESERKRDLAVLWEEHNDSSARLPLSRPIASLSFSPLVVSRLVSSGFVVYPLPLLASPLVSSVFDLPLSPQHLPSPPVDS